jgi:hypothetical protein
MKKAAFALVLIMMVAVSFCTADVLPAGQATCIFAYVSSLYLNPNGVHYIVLDGSKEITCTGNAQTLTASTRAYGYLALDTTTSDYKDILTGLMMSISMGWRVEFVIYGTMYGFNAVEYILVPR